MKTFEYTSEFASRFLMRTRLGDGDCIEWTGARVKGYGVVNNNGHMLRAHRASHEMFIGPIPDGMVVMHLCDNPGCVNPDHLRAGTVTENNRDCVAKGRHRIVVTDKRRRAKAAYATNTSGYVGVCLRRGKWLAKIGATYLGSFPTVELAVAARKAAEVSYGR